jgi:hypothetical protein
MIQHEFIFHPGNWIGEGKVAFSATPEILHFYTKWIVEKANPHGIPGAQFVEIQGNDPPMRNVFLFSDITPTNFIIHLENEILGAVDGTGIIDAKTIAWEFHGKEKLEGFEVYELQENGDYLVHAEYTSSDQFRTVIDGRVWKKSMS